MMMFESNVVPLFIISQPRAGSTLLQRVLAGHKEIHTTAETWLMLHPVYALRKSGHSSEYNSEFAYKALCDFLGTLNSGREVYIESLRLMATRIYHKACEPSGAKYFLDKTPRYYYIIPELAEIFPEAKFIFLFRNPLAVLMSILETWVKGNWFKLSNNDDNLRLAPKKLIEGKALLGKRGLSIKYEDLVSHPTTTVSKICEFLGFDYSVHLLDYGSRPAPLGNYGDSTGIDKHGRPSDSGLDKWLELGTSTQNRHFAVSYLREMGPSMVKDLGYDSFALESKIQSTEIERDDFLVTWDQIFISNKSLKDKLSLTAAEFAQQRRIRYSTKQFVKVLLRWKEPFLYDNL